MKVKIGTTILSAVMLISCTGAGCGTGETTDDMTKVYQTARKLGIHKVVAKEQVIDPEFRSYVVDFDEFYGTSTDISVQFDHGLSDDHLGLCEVYYYRGTKQITINPRYWLVITEAERWMVITHELLHCVKGVYGHNTEVDEDGLCSTVMYP
jgi:hypothetical protein